MGLRSAPQDLYSVCSTALPCVEQLLCRLAKLKAMAQIFEFHESHSRSGCVNSFGFSPTLNGTCHNLRVFGMLQYPDAWHSMHCVVIGPGDFDGNDLFTQLGVVLPECSQ